MADDKSWLQDFFSSLLKNMKSGAVSAGPVPTPDAPGSGQPGTVPPPRPNPAGSVPSGAGVPMIAPTVTAATALSVLIAPSLLRRAGVRDAETWAPIIAEACAAAQINSARRVAAFLANVFAETGLLGRLVESLNYSPEGLMKTWPKRFDRSRATLLGRTAGKPADQRGIAEVAYGGRLGNGPPGSGDGWLFRGRGLIQLTGRANYQAFADKVGVSVQTLPDLLQEPKSAARSAADFWKVSGCNELADRDDITAVRIRVNGGLNGIDAVKAHNRQLRQLLGIT